MEQITFRLTIYRFSAGSRVLRYFSQQEESLDLSRLGEVVYSWATSLLVWDSIEDKSARDDIHTMLAGFNGTGQVGRQSVRDLWPVLEKLEALGKTQGWMNATSMRSLVRGGEEEFNDDIRIKPAVAFAHHLRWICETFGETPDLVVTYR